ncbi:transposase [Kitasatospora sp. NPDC001683]
MAFCAALVAVVPLSCRESDHGGADRPQVGPGEAPEARLGPVPLVASARGEVRSATVTRQGRHWFVSFLVEDGKQTPERHAMPSTAVGIDRGVKVAATTSDGVFHDRVFATPGETARLRRLQQKQARQKKGSNRRKQTVAAINTITGRIRNRRTDFCAWTRTASPSGPRWSCWKTCARRT